MHNHAHMTYTYSMHVSIYLGWLAIYSALISFEITSGNSCTVAYTHTYMFRVICAWSMQSLVTKMANVAFTHSNTLLTQLDRRTHTGTSAEWHVSIHGLIMQWIDIDRICTHMIEGYIFLDVHACMCDLDYACMHTHSAHAVVPTHIPSLMHVRSLRHHRRSSHMEHTFIHTWLNRHMKHKRDMHARVVAWLSVHTCMLLWYALCIHTHMIKSTHIHDTCMTHMQPRICCCMCHAQQHMWHHCTCKLMMMQHTPTRLNRLM